MDPLFGGLLTGGLSLFGNMMGQSNNQSMMQQQQAFQAQMSNTAYQRASTDMKAAGLNPMMMFGSGSAASTPSGATPMQSPMTNLGDSMQKGISTAVAMKTADATINNLVEQNAKIKAETLTEARRPLLVGEQAVATARHGERDAAETYKTRESMPIVINEAVRSENERELRSTPAGKLLDQAGMAGRKVSDVISPATNLISSAKGIRGLFSGDFESRFRGDRIIHNHYNN